MQVTLLPIKALHSLPQTHASRAPSHTHKVLRQHHGPFLYSTATIYVCTTSTHTTAKAGRHRWATNWKNNDRTASANSMFHTLTELPAYKHGDFILRVIDNGRYPPLPLSGKATGFSLPPTGAPLFSPHVIPFIQVLTGQACYLHMGFHVLTYYGLRSSNRLLYPHHDNTSFLNEVFI